MLSLLLLPPNSKRYTCRALPMFERPIKALGILEAWRTMSEQSCDSMRWTRCRWLLQTRRLVLPVLPDPLNSSECTQHYLLKLCRPTHQARKSQSLDSPHNVACMLTSIIKNLCDDIHHSVVIQKRLWNANQSFIYGDHAEFCVYLRGSTIHVCSGVTRPDLESCFHKTYISQSESGKHGVKTSWSRMFTHWEASNLRLVRISHRDPCISWIFGDDHTKPDAP